MLRDSGAAAVAGPALSLHAATASYGDGGDDLVAVESDSRAAAAGGLRSLHAVLPSFVENLPATAASVS